MKMAEEISPSSSSAPASEEEEQFKNRNLIIFSVAADLHTDDLTEALMTLCSFSSIKSGMGSVKKLVIKNFKDKPLMLEN